MTRKLLCVAAGAAVLWAAGGVFAQDEIELATRSAELQELSEILFSRDELDRRQVRSARDESHRVPGARQTAAEVSADTPAPHHRHTQFATHNTVPLTPLRPETIPARVRDANESSTTRVEAVRQPPGLIDRIGVV